MLYSNYNVNKKLLILGTMACVKLNNNEEVTKERGFLEREQTQVDEDLINKGTSLWTLAQSLVSLKFPIVALWIRPSLIYN